MPAIQPARLRQQAALLAEHFGDPPAYTRSLHYLLDYYADRARRPGQSGKPPPLITAYNVRLPVLRLILQETLPLAANDPQASLALCDALWEEPYLEIRNLATMLLGQLPPQPPEPITQRVKSWLTAELDEYLITALLTNSLDRLRKEEPQHIVELIQEWLNEPGIFYQQVGLQALLFLIQDPNFENLPAFYRMLQPLARSTPIPLRPDLLDVLKVLAQRSPQETAYFLRQTLETPNATDTPWLIRQTLHHFPDDLHRSLHESLRDLE